jgi:hypothetical protein
MKVKIFSFADDVAGLEKSLNEWLAEEGKDVEIISKTQSTTFDDYRKKVVITIVIWYK